LRFLFGGEYARYAGLFLIVMGACSVLLTAMILGDAVVACHRFKSRLMAVALGLLVNVAICRQFMGTYGLETAAWAAFISSTTITVTCGLVLLMAITRGKNKKAVS
jgi:O-antigen/teichoic acid export membrane protein